MSITGSRTQLALSQQAYKPAMQRTRCGNCVHFREGENPHLADQCKKGGFMVTAWAICDVHELKKRVPS